RINLQHYLWNDGLGYILHPSIPTDTEDLVIADIGSGTAIWLIEMSRRLRPSAVLHGLDVSHDQSPPAHMLPSNVSLRIHDCLTVPTEDILGSYDIVHIQNFNSVVRNNDPVPVIQHVLKMLSKYSDIHLPRFSVNLTNKKLTLEPGGYLTWGEYDFQTWRSKTLPSAMDYDDELRKLLIHNATQDSWTAKLPQTYLACGLTNIVVERVPFLPEVTTFLLDTFMVASHELSVKILDRLGEGRGDMSRSYIETIGKNRRNLEVALDRLTVIGQKPRR
ncbi:hypothetical protein P154DRAFT_591736, partial [Amniculicola lignicola CBS 123094]